MKIKTKRVISLFSLLALLLVIGTTNVYALSDGDDGDAHNGSNTTVNGGNGDSDTQNVPVEGTIGKYDNTLPVDPTDPLAPGEGDNRWVNVTVPTKIIFASTQFNNGAIIGPKYTITNHSSKKVDVSVDSFSPTIKEPQELSGMTLVLNVANLINGSLMPPQPIQLRNADNSTLQGRTRIALLNAGTRSKDDGPIDTNKGSVEIKMGGQLPGLPGEFEYGARLNPQYHLVLNFSVPTA